MEKIAFLATLKSIILKKTHKHIEECFCSKIFYDEWYLYLGYYLRKEKVKDDLNGSALKCTKIRFEILILDSKVFCHLVGKPICFPSILYYDTLHSFISLGEGLKVLYDTKLDTLLHFCSLFWFSVLYNNLKSKNVFWIWKIFSLSFWADASKVSFIRSFICKILVWGILLNIAVHVKFFKEVLENDEFFHFFFKWIFILKAKVWLLFLSLLTM